MPKLIVDSVACMPFVYDTTPSCGTELYRDNEGVEAQLEDGRRSPTEKSVAVENVWERCTPLL